MRRERYIELRVEVEVRALKYGPGESQKVSWCQRLVLVVVIKVVR